MGNESMMKGSIVYRYSPRPFTIYLNVTNRCSNNCCFCIKKYSSGLSGYHLWLEREPTFDEIWSAFNEEIRPSDNEVVWCGFGEPTMRFDIVLDLTSKIKKKYPRLIVRLDTDGLSQLRNNDREVARELKEAGIDSISISLNAENKEKYDLLCSPIHPKAYQGVINFIKDCKKYFSLVRLTVVNINGIDVSKCKKIAEKLGCDFKIRG